MEDQERENKFRRICKDTFQMKTFKKMFCDRKDS